MNRERFRQNVERYGLVRAWNMRVMSLLNSWGLEVNYVMTRPLQETDPVRLDGIDCRLASREELYLACDSGKVELTRQFVDAALSNDDYCCAAFDDGNLVAYAWRTGLEAPNAKGTKVVVGEKQRYGYKVFTHPEYRGRGIYPRIANLADGEFIRRGKVDAVSFTASTNYSSLAADKKMGNRILGVALILKIGSWTGAFHSPGLTKAGFRFVVEDRI